MNGGLHRIGSRQTAGRGSFVTVRRWNWARSLPILLFFLSLSLSLFSSFISVRCPFPGTRTPTSSPSLLFETVLLPSPPFFFVRQFRYSSPPTCSSAESTIAGRCSFFLQTSTERAQARGFACSLCPRSFGSIPAGNVNTLSTAAKVVASYCIAHVLRVRYRNLYKSLGTLIEIIRIWIVAIRYLTII